MARALAQGSSALTLGGRARSENSVSRPPRPAHCPPLPPAMVACPDLRPEAPAVLRSEEPRQGFPPGAWGSGLAPGQRGFKPAPPRWLQVESRLSSAPGGRCPSQLGPTAAPSALWFWGLPVTERRPQAQGSGPSFSNKCRFHLCELSFVPPKVGLSPNPQCP